MSKKRESYIAKAPIKRLMHKEGATLVSEKALKYTIELLSKKLKIVVEKTVQNVKADKRKRITADDISEAIRDL